MPKKEMNTLVVGTNEYEIVDATARSSVSNKMQLVSNPTSNNLLAVNSWGQAVDSGKKLSDLQNKLTAGNNITISENTISATDTKYTAGTNVQISSSNVISATDTKYSAGRNIRFNGNTIIGTNNAVGFSSGTLLDALVSNDDCTDFFKLGGYECTDMPVGYKNNEASISVVRQRDNSFSIKRGDVTITIFGIENLTFKRRIYENSWSGDWNLYRGKKNTFARKILTTTSGTTAPYSWSVNAKVSGYNVVNWVVYPGYAGSKITNAEAFSSNEVISGYSSDASTPIRVMVFYVASDYITIL